MSDKDYHVVSDKDYHVLRHELKTIMTPVKEPHVLLHELKTVAPFFQAVWSRRKTAELRKNDRGFTVGDSLLLKEYGADIGYTGRQIMCVITHILEAPAFGGLTEGWVVLSIAVLWTREKPTDMPNCTRGS